MGMVAGALLWSWAGTGFAQIFSVTQGSGVLSASIPDNSAVGIANELTVSGATGAINAVQVQLNVTSRGSGPMFNGDLYATLSHSSGMSVLLNRVGKRSDSAIGYADNGFNITLSDSGASDVHTYRVTLTGNNFTPISLADPAQP
jgi:hypothetical protein